LDSPSNYGLSILEPQSNSSSPIAVYTDNGFFGFIPTSSEDKFFQTPAKTIYGIYTVSAVPEPGLAATLVAGCFALLCLATGRRVP
jgi:hypothetical protein